MTASLSKLCLTKKAGLLDNNMKPFRQSDWAVWLITTSKTLLLDKECYSKQADFYCITHGNNFLCRFPWAVIWFRNQGNVRTVS